MAPKKKAPTNGYFYLLMELRNKMDMKSANEEAARLWPQMTAAEKEPYNLRAKKGRNGAIKMTAANENLALVLKQEQDAKEQLLFMQDDIKRQIRFLSESNTITEEYFHIMHVNNFFVTTDMVYYPAEIAIVRFNFKDGVLDENVYNSIIKPGKFPIGYMGSAKIASDDTHKINYMNTENCNMGEVTRDIFEFLRVSANLSCNPAKLPPIYVKDDFKRLVKDVLFQMADTYGYDPEELQIYSLSFLLYTLRNDIRNTVVWPSISQSINEFDRDIFDYTPEIPCEYHKYEAECPVHCSRSHVVRMAYILCDNCCEDMGIPLVPGRHVPKDAITEKLISSASSVSSMRTASESHVSSDNQSYRSNISTVDFDDRSTMSNDPDLGWIDVQSVSSSLQSSEADSWSTVTNKRVHKGGPPRSDWRNTETNFCGGRGRRIANRK